MAIASLAMPSIIKAIGHHQSTAAARDAVKKEALRRAGIGYRPLFDRPPLGRLFYEDNCRGGNRLSLPIRQAPIPSTSLDVRGYCRAWAVSLSIISISR